MALKLKMSAFWSGMSRCRSLNWETQGRKTKTKTVEDIETIVKSYRRQQLAPAAYAGKRIDWNETGTTQFNFIRKSSFFLVSFSLSLTLSLSRSFAYDAMAGNTVFRFIDGKPIEMWNRRAHQLFELSWIENEHSNEKIRTQTNKIKVDNEEI